VYGTWHIWETEDGYRGFWWGEVRERDHLDNICIDERIILNLICKK
jgi:hypothetical protein